MIRFVTAIVIGLFVSSAPFAQQAPSIAKPIAEKKVTQLTTAPIFS